MNAIEKLFPVSQQERSFQLKVRRDAGTAAPGWVQPQFVECKKCGRRATRQVWTKSLYVCPNCGVHLPIGAYYRLSTILDHGTFKELNPDLAPNDVLHTTTHAAELAELSAQENMLLQRCTSLTPEDRVFLARRPDRPHIGEIIDNLFTDFFEQCGDRQCKEDAAILCGIARFHGMPVTVLGHRKGTTLEENLRCNFGMPGPEGYRKALRVMKQAEKFRRPIITFIDTPGAYPGKDAEERGQGEAIARNLMEMSGLTVPVLAIVTGEGSSGGALGLGVANHILMLENAVYSVLSPEGFASILWKDASRSGEACTMMKLTAQDLYTDGIVEEIIAEPLGGAQRGRQLLFSRLDTAIAAHLAALCKMSGKALADQRYKKYRRIGEMRGA